MLLVLSKAKYPEQTLNQCKPEYFVRPPSDQEQTAQIKRGRGTSHLDVVLRIPPRKDGNRSSFDHRLQSHESRLTRCSPCALDGARPCVVHSFVLARDVDTDYGGAPSTRKTAAHLSPSSRRARRLHHRSAACPGVHGNAIRLRRSGRGLDTSDGCLAAGLTLFLTKLGAVTAIF